MEKKKIEFSADEANAVIEILHIALKAEGLNVAKFCTAMQEKLQSAFKSEEEEEVEK